MVICKGDKVVLGRFKRGLLRVGSDKKTGVQKEGEKCCGGKEKTKKPRDKGKGNWRENSLGGHCRGLNDW